MFNETEILVGLSVLVIATFDDPVCRQPPARFSLRPIFMLGGRVPVGVGADGAWVCGSDAGKRALGGGGDVRDPRGRRCQYQPKRLPTRRGFPAEANL